MIRDHRAFDAARCQLSIGLICPVREDLAGNRHSLAPRACLAGRRCDHEADKVATHGAHPARESTGDGLILRRPVRKRAMRFRVADPGACQSCNAHRCADLVADHPLNFAERQWQAAAAKANLVVKSWMRAERHATRLRLKASSMHRFGSPA